MKVRPYKLFGEHERTAAAAGIEGRLAAWIPAWLPGDTVVQVECAPACELKDRFSRVDASQWTRYASTQDQWLASIASQSELRELAGALFGGGEAGARTADTARPDLALEATLTALRELALALLGETPREIPAARRGAGAAPDADAWAPGSASLAIRASIAQARIDLVSSAGWTQQLLAQQLPQRVPAALERRSKAIASQRVALRVLAGSIDIDLRAFKALDLGDVITLDTRIDEPMAVVVASGAGAPACAGRLGDADGWKAVALAPSRA